MRQRMHRIYTSVGLFTKYFGGLLIVLLFLSTAGAGILPNELISKKKKPLDPALIVSASALLQNGTSKRAFRFIDIRSREAFNEMHIPGSINLPIHFISTKAWLASSPMILVDQGLATHRWMPLCEDLREKGLDVRILDGGLVAWESNGGAIIRSSSSKIEFGKITPAEFHMEMNFQTRVVCDVSASRSQASLQLLSDAVHLPLPGNAESRFEMADRFRRVYSRSGANTIIVVNNDGEGYRSVYRLFRRAGCNNVFFLQGGLKALKRYLGGLAQSWLPPEDRLVSENPCLKCGESIVHLKE